MKKKENHCGELCKTMGKRQICIQQINRPKSSKKEMRANEMTWEHILCLHFVFSVCLSDCKSAILSAFARLTLANLAVRISFWIHKIIALNSTESLELDWKKDPPEKSEKSKLNPFIIYSSLPCNRFNCMCGVPPSPPPPPSFLSFALLFNFVCVFCQKCYNEILHTHP